MMRHNGNKAGQVRAPWHLWLLSAIVGLYGALAAFDNAQTLLNGGAYMRASGMTEAQVAYFTTVPRWFDVASTASVWAGLIGALLMLSRSKLAVPAYLVSAAATATGAVYLYLLSDGPAAMGALWLMPLVIGAIMLAMAWYAAAMVRRGVLR